MRLSQLFVAAVMTAATFLLPVCAFAQEDAQHPAGQFIQNGKFTTADLNYPIIWKTAENTQKKSQWQIQKIEIPDQEKVLDIIHIAVVRSGKQLKPLSIESMTGDYIVPTLVFVPATITNIERMGKPKTIAFYDHSMNFIAITYSALDSGENGIEEAFTHELGHWVWYNILNEREKQQYLGLSGKPNQHDQDLLKAYNIDENRLVEEWFAEDFRVYAAKVPDNGVESNFGNSHGNPEKLHSFFNKFRKVLDQGGQARAVYWSK